MVSKNDPASKLRQLLHEKQKKEKKLNKEVNAGMINKYAADNLKRAKKMMLKNAMTIDTTEYEKIAAELKERLDNKR